MNVEIVDVKEPSKNLRERKNWMVRRRELLSTLLPNLKFLVNNIEKNNLLEPNRYKRSKYLELQL